MNNFIMIVLYRNHRSLLLYLLPDNYCVSLCWCTCSRLLLGHEHYYRHNVLVGQTAIIHRFSGNEEEEDDGNWSDWSHNILVSAMVFRPFTVHQVTTTIKDIVLVNDVVFFYCGDGELL